MFANLPGCHILSANVVLKNTRLLLKLNRIQKRILIQVANNQTDAVQSPPTITFNPNKFSSNPKNLISEKVKNEKMNKNFIRLLEDFYLNNLPLEALNYCYSIFSTNFIVNQKTLMLAAKIVAMCHTTKTIVSSIDPNKLNLILNRLQNELPNSENSIRLTIQLLLDASNGDWSKINSIVEIPDKVECFAILACILIERKEFDILSSLCSIIEPKQKFYQHPILWDTFLNFLEENNGTNQSKELLQLLMDQIVSLGKTINSEEFEYIKDALSYFNGWKLEKATISKETLECSVCKEKLPKQQALDGEQFLKLKDAFKERLERGMSSRISGGGPEIQKFYKTLDNLIKNEPLNNKKPLIVDGLNLAVGSFTSDRFPYFNKIIVGMIKEGFSPILIISKLPFGYFYENKLKNLNVKLFSVESHFKRKYDIKRKYAIEDDLFAINSAFYLGPNTHLLSNDMFVDHIETSRFLPEIAPLFETWKETRCISFITYELDEEKYYKLPNPFHTQIQGDALRGYHLFIKDKRDDDYASYVKEESVYCIRTN